MAERELVINGRDRIFKAGARLLLHVNATFSKAVFRPRTWTAREEQLGHGMLEPKYGTITRQYRMLEEGIDIEEEEKLLATV